MGGKAAAQQTLSMVDSVEEPDSEAHPIRRIKSATLRTR